MNDDNVEGRARVKHTPQLDAYYEELAEYDAGALWTVANDIEPWEPKAHSIPMIWRYRQLRPLVLQSLELVRPEEAGRRVVMLVNPKRHDVSAAVGLLYTGLQVMNPGRPLPPIGTWPRPCASSSRAMGPTPSSRGSG